MTTTEYNVPSRFYWDHVERDLPGGTIVSESTRQVRVLLTSDQAADLRSDAAYYETEWQSMGSEYRGLGRSAAATVEAIDRATSVRSDNDAADAAERKG